MPRTALAPPHGRESERELRHRRASPVVRADVRPHGGHVRSKGGAEHRRELLAGASGQVIEIGAGTGLNFRHYPDTVTEVLAVEPEAYLRARAERAAQSAAVPVHVIAGTADALPAEDESFDVAVASLVLC